MVVLGGVFVVVDDAAAPTGSQIFGCFVCAANVFGVVLRMKMLGDDEDDDNGGDVVGAFALALNGALAFLLKFSNRTF